MSSHRAPTPLLDTQIPTADSFVTGAKPLPSTANDQTRTRVLVMTSDLTRVPVNDQPRTIQNVMNAFNMSSTEWNTANPSFTSHSANVSTGDHYTVRITVPEFLADPITNENQFYRFYRCAGVEKSTGNGVYNQITIGEAAISGNYGAVVESNPDGQFTTNDLVLRALNPQAPDNSYKGVITVPVWDAWTAPKFPNSSPNSVTQYRLIPVQGNSYGPRYSPFFGNIAALAPIPGGFTDTQYRNGVIAMINTTDLAGIQRQRVALRPAAGQVEGYARNWDVLDADLQLRYRDNSGGYLTLTPRAMLASQRIGSRAMAICQSETNNTSGNFGVTTIVRLDGKNSVTHDDYFANVWGFIPIYGGPGDMFVSEDENPFVWYTEVYSSVQYASAFWDSKANFAADDDTYHQFLGYRRPGSGVVIQQEGQLGAYRQKLPQLNGSRAYLVHPWSAGDYGPPELWHVVRKSDRVFTIYRATWMRGVWTMPSGYEFFDGQGINRRFPDLNPHGYGWDPDPFQASKIVSTITLPGSGAIGDVAPGFVFMRDPELDGVLHIAVAAGTHETNLV